jgi:putative endonuclease
VSDDRPEAVSRGRLGETIAAAYLELAGYRVRRRNVRFGPREVDLVVTRGRELVFVEVKLRSSGRRGGAIHAMDQRKRRELARATGPLMGRLRAAGWRVRLDLIALQLETGRGRLTVRHQRGVGLHPSTFVS